MIDPRSIVLVMTVTSFGLALIFWIISRQARIPKASQVNWRWSTVLLVSSFGLFSLAGVITREMTAVLGGPLLVLAVLLQGRGQLAFREAPQRDWVVAALVTLMIVNGVTFGLLSPSFRWRISFGSLILGAACVVTALAFLKERREHLRMAALLIGVPYLVLAAWMMVRAGVVVFSAEGVSALAPTLLNTLTLLFTVVGLICPLCGLNLLVSTASTADLLRLAHYDTATGALSRAGLYERMPQWRVGSSSEVRVTLFDLNGFKKINDQHGHAVGDVVLRACAESLHESVPEASLVARIGGDEFVVVSHESDGESAWVHTAERRVRSALARQHPAVKLATPLWAHGVSMLNAQYPNLDATIERSDMHMYAQKRRSRSVREWATTVLGKVGSD